MYGLSPFITIVSLSVAFSKSFVVIATVSQFFSFQYIFFLLLVLPFSIVSVGHATLRQFTLSLNFPLFVFPVMTVKNFTFNATFFFFTFYHIIPPPSYFCNILFRYIFTRVVFSL